jgi:mRNA-degrading endonuclease toxin of MazEF toxin-antitoxin module
VTIRQGEIRDLVHGAYQVKVVVVSGDAWNEHFPPIIAPILRNLADMPPAIIALHNSDPYAGAVVLAELGAVNATDVGDTVHGIVLGDTMRRIREAVATIVED